mgnify:CR=1 FL=1
MRYPPAPHECGPGDDPRPQTSVHDQRPNSTPRPTRMQSADEIFAASARYEQLRRREPDIERALRLIADTLPHQQRREVLRALGDRL